MQVSDRKVRRNTLLLVVLLAVVLCWPWAHRTFFGAAGSANPAKKTASALVGRWQSVDDPKFVRGFTAEGKCTEWYDRRQMINEEYHVYGADGVPKELVPMPEAGAVYLTIGGVGPDMLVFRVVGTPADALELNYLARGSTLRFTRL